jgi:hypothetical protein
VPAPALGAVLLVAFLALEALTERMKRWRWLPLGVLGLVLGAAGMELARYDHGQPDWLLWIGWVGAPVATIFGGALWGARRWYGWPDLGPAPGRLAAVASALLVGILVGSRVKESDVTESMRRADLYAATVRENEFRRVMTMGTEYERTAMGWFAPPRYAYDEGTGILSFPIGGGRQMTLDVRAQAKDAKWTVR